MKDLNIHLNAPEGGSAEELSAYLDEACGDDADLRERVEALFAAEARAHSRFLEGARPDVNTTLETDPAEAPSDEGVGTIIGRYKLLEKLGEGGFGSVWAAEQRESVKRRVALKIVKLGMDTKQVVARFEAERQALALMDHPNIAKVLDVGATDSGRPFFVMELVKGVSITQYCAQEKLSLKDRLDLFVKVCHAVQHAHQKGIIHRDIKPSNIMVTLHDGVPVPKVIDFGIAKATQQELTEKTIYTQYSQFIGTPAYMSPEQAEMSGLDIDTRSDIYSLGVLLYELLTGSTPFDSQELLASGIDEMRKIIRERDPVKPSTRISQTLASPQVDPKPDIQHRPLSSDLDWIVLKCLEKDRVRRYESANGLAMDIHRHLNDEVIIARPPSPSYKLQKAWRRNRLAFGTVAAVILILSVGIVVTTWHMREANRLRIAADDARGVAIEERERSDSLKVQADANALSALRRQYASDMFLANEAAGQNNYGRARQLLDRHRPENNGGFDLRGWEWRYLWSLCRGDELRTVGVEEARMLRSLSISRDGRRVAVASVNEIKNEDGEFVIPIYDLHTLQRLELATPAQALSVAYHPTKDVLVSGHRNGQVMFHDATTQLPTQLPMSLDPEIRDMVFSALGNWIFIKTVDKGILVQYTDRGFTKVMETPMDLHFTETPNAGFSFFDPHENWLVLDAEQEGVDPAMTKDVPSVIDLRSEPPILSRLSIDAISVYGAGFSPDGTKLLTIIPRTKLRLHKWGKLQATVLKDSANEEFIGWYSKGLYSPDGRYVYTSGFDQLVRVWDAEELVELKILKGHKDEIWSMDISQDGRFLVTGGKDGEIKLWQTNHQDTGRPTAVRSIEYATPSTSPDGRWLSRWSAVDGPDQYSVDVVDANSMVYEKKITWPRDPQVRGKHHWHALSNDPSLYARVGSDGLCLVRDDNGAQQRTELDMSGENATYPLFDAHDRYFGAGSRRGIVRVWDLKTSNLKLEIPNIPTRPEVIRGGFPFAFSPDAPLLAVFGEDRQSLEIWDIEVGQRIEHGEYDLKGQLSFAVFLPGTKLLVATSLGGYLSLIDYETGEVLRRQKSQKLALHGLDLSTIDGRVVVGTNHEGIRLWTNDIENELMVIPLPHESNYVRFSLDGNTIHAHNGEYGPGRRHTSFTAPTWEYIQQTESAEGEQ